MEEDTIECFMKYSINLTKEQEKFLDKYLKDHPLRPEHKRRDYPGLIAKNFINSMIKYYKKEGIKWP